MRGSARSAAPGPYPFRISTITATGSVSTKIDLNSFFENVEIRQRGPGFICASHYYPQAAADDTAGGFAVEDPESDDASVATEPAATGDVAAPAKPAKPQYTLRVRGELPQKARRRRKKLRPFDNQTTVVYAVDDAHAGLLNMKVFRNGNVQITGIKFPQQGLLAIDYLIACLATMSIAVPGVIADRADLCNARYQVCLVNCDFHAGFEIKRKNLYDDICELGVRCAFEPCIYPGVKVQFFWNTFGEARNLQTDGICRCPLGAKCDGKGTGRGQGDCRKVTIAVFQSGCVIVTGAHTLEQIQNAYDFIVAYLARQRDMVERKRQLPAAPSAAPPTAFSCG